MNIKKKLFLIISMIILCSSLPAAYVSASTWTFKPAKDKNNWKSVSENLLNLKNTSVNTVSEDEVTGNKEVKNGDEATKDKPVKTGDDTGQKPENNNENEPEEKTNINPDDWRLLLVNKQNPIPDDYEAVMVPISGGVTIREEVKEPLQEMFDAAMNEGISLQACSGYRSHAHQQELFDRKIRNYTRSGLSYLDAFRIGSYSVIIPGTSEHELGMAVDIITPGYSALNEGFAATEAGRWLKNNAYNYGFILRYPKGKEYITGIIFEPWHYRYVGKEAAEDISKSGLTLEEYLEEAELY